MRKINDHTLCPQKGPINVSRYWFLPWSKMHFKHNPGLDKEVLYDYSTQSPNLNKIDENKARLGCFKYSVCACVLRHFSCVWLGATLWTVACQAPLSMGFSRARILEWVSMPSSRRSSQPRDQTHGLSCIFCTAGEFFTTEPLREPKSLQSCLTLCDPMDVVHQAFLSIGFSRQEH